MPLPEGKRKVLRKVVHAHTHITITNIYLRRHSILRTCSSNTEVALKHSLQYKLNAVVLKKAARPMLERNYKTKLNETNRKGQYRKGSQADQGLLKGSHIAITFLECFSGRTRELSSRCRGHWSPVLLQLSSFAAVWRSLRF